MASKSWMRATTEQQIQKLGKLLNGESQRAAASK
jgi:hypothetical protein